MRQRAAGVAVDDARGGALAPRVARAAEQRLQDAASGEQGDAAVSEGAVEGFDENDPATWGNPGRNDPCPCGSGKKFKHCHGRLA